MTRRRADTRAPETQPAPDAGPDRIEGSRLREEHAAAIGISQRAAHRAHSPEEADERYVAARDAWTKAMHASASGRPADLAALAVAQEAYEEALAEKERWDSGTALAAIPVEPDRPRSLEAIVHQEMARRLVHQHEEEAAQRPKGIRRLFRRRG